jgi:hypothetical protein
MISLGRKGTGAGVDTLLVKISNVNDFDDNPEGGKVAALLFLTSITEATSSVSTVTLTAASPTGTILS